MSAHPEPRRKIKIALTARTLRAILDGFAYGAINCQDDGAQALADGDAELAEKLSRMAKRYQEARAEVRQALGSQMAHVESERDISLGEKPSAFFGADT